jgi:hypothetical protein
MGAGEGSFGGSRLRLRLPMLVALLALALLAGSAAPAKAAQDDTLVAFFEVDAGNGFSMNVAAFREPRNPTEVEVTLASDSQSAIYSKDRGVRFTRNELNFRLASLGSVEMDFERGRRFNLDDQCNIKVLRTRFIGRLHFRGEGAYTRAHARKASGYLVRQSGADKCRLLSHNSDRSDNEPATLTSCGPGPQLAFYGSAEGLFGGSFFLALSQESSDGLDIIRTAFADGNDGDFGFDDDYRHAKVRPAWPFAGTGVYDEGELTGDLSVSFAGAPDRLLAPSSRAKLRESRRARGRQCGVDYEIGLYPYGFYSAPGSAPEDPAAVGFYRR